MLILAEVTALCIHLCRPPLFYYNLLPYITFPFFKTQNILPNSNSYPTLSYNLSYTPPLISHYTTTSLQTLYPKPYHYHLY